MYLTEERGMVQMLMQEHRMFDNELTRNRLRLFLDQTGLQAKFIADRFAWDYAFFLKFKNGQKNLSQERLKVLNSFMEEYLEAIRNL